MKNKILVTGGTGYIGSHTVVDLLINDYEVIIVDDLSRSSKETLKGIAEITGKIPSFYLVDLKEKKAIEEVFEKEKNIKGVIHFAAYKYVDESVDKSLSYYQNNVAGLLNLLEIVKKHNIPSFVFSSSCSVYGNIDKLPVSEKSNLNPTQSPYATTKLMGEMILEDVKNELNTHFISLRYFNPVGAHHSSMIGESPAVIPNNILPRITGTALGKFDKLKVFGYKLDTRDGSCIRDYIHVMDIAEAHTLALKKIEEKMTPHTHSIINLGSGQGVTVLELIDAFEKNIGIKIKVELSPTRQGDVVAVYSDNTLAKEELNWSPKRTIKDMIVSAWEWDKKSTKI